MTYNLVKVARAPVMVCLQCPLCCNLVHEATTISECLHTFCRDCIYQQLGDGENDCCPICNVNLGCSPLEKLRADHQLDDVRAKIFPVKSRKRKVIDNNVDCDAPAPIKRKERSLSSLGIGTAPTSANPGFVSRRTKSVSRRAVTNRDTSAENEFEDKNSVGAKSKNTVQERYGSEGEGTKGGSQEDDSSDGKVGNLSEEKPEIITSAKREVVSDEERGMIETGTLHSHRAQQLALCGKGLPAHVSQEQSRMPQPSANGSHLVSKLGIYLAERSKISANGLLGAQGFETSDHHDSKFAKHNQIEQHDFNTQKLPAAFPLVKERTGKGFKRRSALAQLAEIAVGQAVGTSESPKPRRPRARRGGGKNTSLKIPAVGENSDWHSVEKNPKATTSELQHNFLPLVKSSTLDKLPIVRKAGSSRRTSTNRASIPKQDKQDGGFWFALQAADNQMGDNALPQIPTRYLRIKDGKLPVSIVKKYIVKKLELKSETEVEITCRGQPVVPNLPLESVQGIWFATMPPSDLLPFRGVNAASYDSRKWAQARDTCAEDCMMVLTYGRHRRPIINH